MNTTLPGEAQPAPPANTANPAPVQRPGSVRRTTSIDVEWPEGLGGPRRFHGRARDYRDGTVLGAAKMTATLSPEKVITALEATPAPARIGELVGQRGGGHLRVLMSEIMPELIAAADPLYLLLDDISGTCIVCDWGWSLWHADWLSRLHSSTPPAEFQKLMDERADICFGLQRGHSGMNVPVGQHKVGTADGGELRNPADPQGWHEFPKIPGVSMRRARRIDVWRGEDGLIHIDAAFQDSAPRPDGTRAALHEYRISATAEPGSLNLATLEPEARVLPFHECPGAIVNARKLVGTPLPEIRKSVLAQLRGTAGCTHLNDALRALAEVTRLVNQL